MSQESETKTTANTLTPAPTSQTAPLWPHILIPRGFTIKNTPDELTITWRWPKTKYLHMYNSYLTLSANCSTPIPIWLRSAVKQFMPYSPLPLTNRTNYSPLSAAGLRILRPQPVTLKTELNA